jgi:hypothetical protein
MGNFANSLSSLFRKNISLRDLVEAALLILPSRPHNRDGPAIVTDVEAGRGGVARRAH